MNQPLATYNSNIVSPTLPNPVAFVFVPKLVLEGRASGEHTGERSTGGSGVLVCWAGCTESLCAAVPQYVSFSRCGAVGWLVVARFGSFRGRRFAFWLDALAVYKTKRKTPHTRTRPKT